MSSFFWHVCRMKKRRARMMGPIWWGPYFALPGLSSSEKKLHPIPKVLLTRADSHKKASGRLHFLSHFFPTPNVYVIFSLITPFHLTLYMCYKIFFFSFHLCFPSLCFQSIFFSNSFLLSNFVWAYIFYVFHQYLHFTKNFLLISAFSFHNPPCSQVSHFFLSSSSAHNVHFPHRIATSSPRKFPQLFSPHKSSQYIECSIFCKFKISIIVRDYC